MHTNRKYTKHTFVAESKDRDATKVGGSKLYTKIPVHLRVIEDVARQVHPHRSVGGLINWCVVLLLL